MIGSLNLSLNPITTIKPQLISIKYGIINPSATPRKNRRESLLNVSLKATKPTFNVDK
jgi:hypothetical protein